MSDNIKVGIKVRPLIKREEDERLPIQWVVEDNYITQIDPDTNRRHESQFHFDYIFDLGTTNEHVFNATAKPIVEAAMHGINGTIFTYGQTGSGKTYTMMGSKTEKGVINLTIDYIFDYIRNDQNRQYLLRVSYIEIYNEKINDLLDKKRTDLKLKEDIDGHIMVDCKEEVASSPENIYLIMKKGEKLKRTGETNMNERSSRSHTIFRIVIESCDRSDPDAEQKEAQLNLIDLAGSERARLTGATGERFNEGRFINLSLSTLSLVIKQLSDTNPSKFISYRDSKLTRILQPSLGGNALTTIICTVTPAAVDETQCTLDFAVRAKGVKNKPQVNETISDKALLKKVLAQVRKLQHELEHKNSEIEEAKKEKDDREQMLQARIHNLLDSIASTKQQEKTRRRRTWAGGNFSKIPMHKNQIMLPTIQEISVKTKSDVRKDKSIIDELNLNDKSFAVYDYPDFELALIKAQQEKHRLSGLSDDGLLPNIITLRQDRDQHYINSPIDETEITPEKNYPNIPEHSCCKRSPGTPKVVLREKYSDLLADFKSLREFTELEKQTFQDWLSDDNCPKHSEKLAFMQKSLEDIESVCNDMNKKYSELQTDHAILKFKHAELETQCDKLNEENQLLIPIRDQFSTVESERNDYKNKMNQALKKLKNLEDEASSHEYAIELLKTKYKKREKELEASLSLAWKDYTDPQEKVNLTNVVHLQLVINELTEKLSSMESRSSSLQSQASSGISADQEDSNSKYQELEDALKKTEEEKLSFESKISELENRLKELSDATGSLSEHKKSIEQYESHIKDLEQIIVNKIADNEVEVNKSLELTHKFEETADKLKVTENIVDEMKNELSEIESKLNEKTNEIAELKKRIEEVENHHEGVNISEGSDEFHLALSEGSISRCNSHLTNGALDSHPKLIVEETSHDLLKNMVEEQKSEITRLEKVLEEKTTELSSAVASFEAKINELQLSNDKLKDQLAAMQSDKTIYEGEKNALQSSIKDLEEQLHKFNKLETQLTFVTAEKEAHEHTITDLRKQLNEKLLELEEQHAHNYDAEIKNLNNYIAEVQSFMKNVQDENDTLKKEIEEMIVNLKAIEDQKKILNQELQTLKQKYADEENAKETVSNLMKNIQDENENLKNEVDKMSQVLANMENVKKSLCDELKTLNKKLLDVNEIKEAMETKVKNCSVENEDLKKEVEKVSILLKNLEDEKKSLQGEIESLKHQLSNSVSGKALKITDNNHNSSFNDFKNTSRISEVIKVPKISVTPNGPAKTQNSTQDPELETSSMFSNQSYFDNMSDVSMATGDVTDSLFLQNSVNDTTANITNGLDIKNNFEDTKNLLDFTYNEIVNNLPEKSPHELTIVVHELYKIKNNLSEENEKLKNTLQSKIRELDEIKNDFSALKSGIQELEKTIMSLTNENAEMATKLADEKNRADEIQTTFQKLELDLMGQIKCLEDEKQYNERSILELKKKLQELQDIKPESSNEDVGQLKNSIEKLENIVKVLTNENEELSTGLMEKIEEIENIRMSKSLQFDHDCKYREKVDYFIEKNSILERENTELSNNLMDKIEELDIITEAYESLKYNVSPDIQRKVEDKMEQSRHLEKSTREMMSVSSMSINYDKANKNNPNSPSSVLEKSLHEIIDRYDENEQLRMKVDKLENEVTELKDLNHKLSSMQLTTCKQCIHLAELNEARRILKNEIKSANKRLQSLETKFQRERASGEKLTSKAKEDINDLNVSVNNVSLNTSYLDGVEIVEAEEQVQRLQTDLESLQERYNTLSSDYKKKCDEVDKSPDDNLDNSLDTFVTLVPESPKIICNSKIEKLNKIQNDLKKYINEHELLNKNIDKIDHKIQKIQNKKVSTENVIENLKSEKVMLEEKLSAVESLAEDAQKQVIKLEDQVKNLEEKLIQLNIDNKDLYDLKYVLENQIEEQKTKNVKLDQYIKELKQTLDDVKDTNLSLQSNGQQQSELTTELKKYKQDVANLEAQIHELTESLQSSEVMKDRLRSELETVKSTPRPEQTEIKVLRENLDEYKMKAESLELSIKDLREKLDYYAKENVDLSEEINKLQAQAKADLNMTDNRMDCDESYSQNPSVRASEELDALRSTILKELHSLGSNENDSNLDEKTVTEIFCIFVNALLAKEQEIVKTLHRRFDRQRNQIEEEKKQLVDAEKRSSAWAKELEADIEKFQCDLSKEEAKCANLNQQIHNLEHLLMESDHEKQLLKEKMEIMETDFNTLQNDIEKNTKANDSSFILHEREKSIQVAIDKCKTEYQTKMNQAEQNYKERIEDLTSTLEHMKTKNMELMNNLEGVEANERQLKSIADMKTNELNKVNTTLQRLQREYENLAELYNQSNEDNQAKSCRIEEITGLLKVKCDKMSEYKMKLETITPEYEALKEQTTERQLRIEKYKIEIETLRNENLKQISLLKDELDTEKIKSAGLTKQINDITNKNTIIQMELQQLAQKCEEISQENIRISKKMRNSTSKAMVEREIEHLKDENRTLSKNLEGASNRISDLQKSKSQLLQEHVELQGQYNLMTQENGNLKNVLENYKSKVSGPDALDLREKYDALVQEKNKIALELEEKRLNVGLLENKIVDLRKECEELKAKNKDLDEEMDMMLEKIREVELESGQLMEQVYAFENQECTKCADLKTKNKDLDEEMDLMLEKIREMDEENSRLMEKIFMLEDQQKDNKNNTNTHENKMYDALKQQYENLKRDFDTTIMTCELLRQENVELKNKICDKKDSSLNNSSSRAPSPASSAPSPSNRSRQRRSDLFNQNRLLEIREEAQNNHQALCECENLRKTIQTLEQNLVLKQAKITTLEMQMESFIFPYKTKCVQYEEALRSYNVKNKQLGAEIKALRAQPRDCEKCKNWRTNRCEKEIQTDKEKPKIWMNGESKSGIVEETAKELQKDMLLAKLKKDKDQLKKLSLSRLDQINKLKVTVKEHEEKERELELQITSLKGPRTGSSYSDTNYRNPMKENVPSNVLGQSQMIPHQFWFN